MFFGIYSGPECEFESLDSQKADFCVNGKSPFFSGKQAVYLNWKFYNLFANFLWI